MYVLNVWENFGPTLSQHLTLKNFVNGVVLSEFHCTCH